MGHFIYVYNTCQKTCAQNATYSSYVLPADVAGKLSVDFSCWQVSVDHAKGRWVGYDFPYCIVRYDYPNVVYLPPKLISDLGALAKSASGGKFGRTPEIIGYCANL